MYVRVTDLAPIEEEGLGGALFDCTHPPRACYKLGWCVGIKWLTYALYCHLIARLFRCVCT